MSSERFSLKDHLFNEGSVGYLADLLRAGIPGFDRAGFVDSVMSKMLDLELKQRIGLIAEVLEGLLDSNFETAAKQIGDSLPPHLDPTLSDDDFGDFIIAPLGEFVARNGLAHYGTSMRLIRELTMRFSMEGPVRVFLDAEPEQTLELFETWARDPNYHVRRLVSESTRPRLPWAPRISVDVRAPLRLLDVLHADPTRYVTRSVANHLNDIAKIEPELVIDRLLHWRDLGWQEPAEMEWMTRHSLRTLVKRGHPGAMEALGFSTEPQVEARLAIQTSIVRAGEALEFSVEVTGRGEEELLVDYVIGFVKKNGSIGPKVFKLKETSIGTGETRLLEKRHPLRGDATTYRLNPGTHTVDIMVNGQTVASGEFEVVT